MRTTLTIDDAIAGALKELARRSDSWFTAVVNRALRAGLQAQATLRAKRYRVKPAALGGVLAGLDPDKALALADALEDREIAATIGRRRRS